MSLRNENLYSEDYEQEIYIYSSIFLRDKEMMEED